MRRRLLKVIGSSIFLCGHSLCHALCLHGRTRPSLVHRVSPLGPAAPRGRAPALPAVAADLPSGEGAELAPQRGATEEAITVATILKFSLPTLGIWISAPLLSLIDTAAVGRFASSLELAALGPATAICDQLTSVFLFLGVATTNLFAGAVADKDPERALEGTTTGLAVAVGVGFTLMAVLSLWAEPLVAAFAGQASKSVVPFAAQYVAIRAWGLPFVLATVVAQAACLGSKESGAALRAVAVAVAVNAALDVLFVPVLGWGIGGAAWATTLSQVAGLASMLSALRTKVLRRLVAQTEGRLDAVPWRLPAPGQAWRFAQFAGPIFFTNLGKFAPYTFATLAVSQAGGALPLAGHQVMLGVYFMFVMFSEPMGMTAQAFLPDAVAAAKANAAAVTAGQDAGKMMTKTTSPVVQLLRRIFAISAGISAAVAGAACLGPGLFPYLFTKDPLVVGEMAKLLPLLFLLILPHPLTMCFEGVLLASRDVKYLTAVYAVNTVGVAAVMRHIATNGGAAATVATGGVGAGAAAAAAAGAAAAADAAAGSTVRAVWGGLIAWNCARCVEQGGRLVARGRKLVGVSILSDVLGLRPSRPRQRVQGGVEGTAVAAEGKSANEAA